MTTDMFDEDEDSVLENEITDGLIFDAVTKHLRMDVLGRGLLPLLACFSHMHPIPVDLVTMLLVSTFQVEQTEDEERRYQAICTQVADHCVDLLYAKQAVDVDTLGVYITDMGQSIAGSTISDALYVARFMIHAIGPITIPSSLDDYMRHREQLFPHLLHLADRLIPTASVEAGLISLIVSLYYAADGDADVLEPYLRQASAIVDLTFEATSLPALSWLAQGLYRVGHLCEDAGMLDAAATAYVGAFDACDQARQRTDLATIGTSLFEFELDSDSWEWQIMQKAVESTLRRGSFQTAEHITQLVRTAVPIAPYDEDDDDDEANPLLADYLDAMIAEARGDDAAARAHLQRIVDWSQQSSAEQSIFIAAFLIPAFVSLAWMEIRAEHIEEAESLVTWATTLLDSDAVQTERPDQPDTPHDLRTPLRARLVEVRGLLYAAQGRRDDALAALRDAQRLMRLTMCATKLDIDRIQQRIAESKGV